MNKKNTPYILLLVLAAVVFIVNNKCNKGNSNDRKTVKDHRGLNRNPSQIHYSKHALCRMDCRHIDEQEVKDILKNGEVNYKKSELNGADCNKRYAVEGTSRDNQRLRIIFAPCASEVTVVTCIDIGKEWECSCEGD